MKIGLEVEIREVLRTEAYVGSVDMHVIIFDEGGASDES